MGPVAMDQQATQLHYYRSACFESRGSYSPQVIVTNTKGTVRGQRFSYSGAFTPIRTHLQELIKILPHIDYPKHRIEWKIIYRGIIYTYILSPINCWTGANPIQKMSTLIHISQIWQWAAFIVARANKMKSMSIWPVPGEQLLKSSYFCHLWK